MTYDTSLVIRKDITLDHTFASCHYGYGGEELGRKIDSTPGFTVNGDDVSLREPTASLSGEVRTGQRGTVSIEVDSIRVGLNGAVKIPAEQNI